MFAEFAEDLEQRSLMRAVGGNNGGNYYCKGVASVYASNYVRDTGLEYAPRAIITKQVHS
jgi:hypothetical protein